VTVQHAHYAGVVFDMDGILIDSEPLFRVAAIRTAAELGYTLADETYVSWMGLPPAAVEAAIVSGMGADFPLDEFREGFRRCWNEHTDAHGVPAQPGIAALLAALRERDIPFSVATSTERVQALRSLELAGLAPYIDIVVAGNQVQRGKPEPEIFLAAAQKIGVAATSCVALEDSAVGVRAASSAGMLTIMVPDLHQPSPSVAALAQYVVPTTTRAAKIVLHLFDSRC
jgi:HAD superfamily hydrolase (TIGR01509 family)